MLLLAVPPPWGSHLSDKRSPPPASLRTVPLGSDHSVSTHLAMARSTKYIGPGSPSSHLKSIEEEPRKNNNQGKRKRCAVAHAGACVRVVGWPYVLKPATMWFGGDESGTIGHRVVMFWRSDMPGHSIAGGAWGSLGGGQQLQGGGGPSGAYTGKCSR